MLQMVGHLYRQIFKENKDTDKQGKEDKAMTFNKDDSKMSNMKEQVVRLQDHNKRLQNQINYSRSREYEFQKVLANYDTLLDRMVNEKKCLIEENSKSQDRLQNFEKAFNDLLQKYEKAKAVIVGFQENEKVLRQQVFGYQKILEEINRRQHDPPKSTDKDNKISTSFQLPATSTNKKRKLITSI